MTVNAGQWAPLPMYRYWTVDGQVAVKRRFGGNGVRKLFPMEKPEGAGELALYCHLQLVRAIQHGRTVTITEGEHDARSLQLLGHVATTTATRSKSFGQWLEVFRGATVRVIGDNDGGKATMEAQAAELERVATVQRYLPPTPHKDVTDFLEAGGSLEELVPVDYFVVTSSDTAGSEDFERALRQERFRIRVHHRAVELERAEQERSRVRLPTASGNLSEQLAHELVPEPEVIAGWWYLGGNVNLGATAKVGKTVVALNVMRSLADGEPFLGRWEVAQQGSIAYFNYELPQRKFIQWCAALQLKHPERVWPLTLRGAVVPMNLEVVAEYIISQLRDHHTETWIVDTKNAAEQGVVLDENDNSEVTRFLRVLDQLKAEAGVQNLLLTTHFGHREERSRGASSLLGWADMNWTLTKDKHDARYLSAFGRDVEQEERQLHYDPTTKRVFVAGGSRQQQAVQERAVQWCLAVIQVLLDEDRLESDQLRRRLKLPSKDRTEAIRTAEVKEYIVRVADGKRKLCCLTDRGKVWYQEQNRDES